MPRFFPGLPFLFLLLAAGPVSRQAVELFEAGDFNGAAREFRKQLQDSPSPASRFNLGLACYYAGQFKEAAQQFEEILASDANHPQAHFMLGVLAKAQGEAEAASRHFSAVRASDPGDPGTLYQLGQVEVLRGDLAAAARFFEASLESDPGNPAALYNLARALLRSGRAEEGRRRMAEFQEIRKRSRRPMMGTMSEPSLIHGKYAQLMGVQAP